VPGYLLVSEVKVMVWQPGKKLKNGQYTIERILGKGGFGITYLATNTSSQRFAIKTLNDDVKNSPYFEKLHKDFQNEATLLRQCAHPNIVKIYDLFLEEDLFLGLFSKGEPLLCMVMEYISGENLLEKVEKRGSLAEANALRYIDQVGKVLTFIHAKNILHRDIKPDNIMLRSDGRGIVLIDFGIARSFVEGKTQIQTALVTPAFSPPEQFVEQYKRGAYSDVYALAATLYFLLTGSPPQFDSIKLKPPKTLNPSISDIVNQAIVKGMELNPAARPQSVEQWLKMLVPKQKVRASVAPTPPLDPQPYWTYVQWVFICWVCLSLVLLRLVPGIGYESLGSEIVLKAISARSLFLAFLAFLTALFAPTTELKKVFSGWRPIIIAAIAAFLGSSVASVEPTWDMTSATLIFAFSGYLVGLLLGIPSTIVGVAKRGLQAYYNRSLTVVILIGTSLAAVGLNWLFFAYPFL
jgi:hypothetical protein